MSIAKLCRNVSEFQVNTTIKGIQRYSSTAGLSDGGFVVFYDSKESTDSKWNVIGQRFDSTGNKVSGEFIVNKNNDVHKLWSVVATFSTGGFIVVYSFPDQKGSGVYAQIYDKDFNTKYAEFQINTFYHGSQSYPSVATFFSGGFIVCWQSWYNDKNMWGVFCQMYDKDYAEKGGEFQVNTYYNGHQQRSSVVTFSDETFLVIWDSFGQDGDNYGIYGQKFDVKGNKLGSEFKIHTENSESQSYNAVAVLSNDSFIITWMSNLQDSDGYGIYAQRFDSNTNKLGSEFQVNTYTTRNQHYPTIVTLTGGGFMIGWDSELQDGTGDGIYGQMFDTDGNKSGDEFQINVYTTGDQQNPHASRLTSGGFVITWMSKGQDTDNYGIFGMRYDKDGNKIESGVELYSNTASQKPVFVPYQSTKVTKCQESVHNYQLIYLGANF